MNSLMLRILLIVLSMTSARSILYALPDDASLSKPVTLAVKGAALVDLMPMLQEQTGVALRVAPEIAERKATVFVDEKPLSEVMEGLSTLFKYRWTSKMSEGRTVYELSEDEKARREREERCESARSKAWKAALEEIKLKERFGLMTEAQIDAYRRSLFADMARNAIKDGLVQLDALNAVERSPITGVVASLVLSSPKVLKALQEGMSVGYDLNSADPEWKLSDAVARRILAVKLRLDKKEDTIADVELVGITVNIASVSSSWAVHVEGDVSISYRNKEGNIISGRMGGTLVYFPIDDFVDLPRDYLPCLNQPIEQKVLLSASDLGEDGRVIHGSDSSETAAVNRSDILELLHKKTGLQIISDHYSYWYQWRFPREGTVGDILAGFGTAVKVPGVYTYKTVWGTDGKYVYMRVRDTGYADSAEVPNKQLQRWREAYERKGYLGLEELGEINQLREEQINTIRRESVRLGLGDYVPTGDALRLYGMLTPGQVERLNSKGLIVSEMTTAQRQVLARLINAGTAGGARVGIYAGDGRDTRPVRLPEQQERMSLFIRDFTCTEYEYSVDGGPRLVSVRADNIDKALDNIREKFPQAKREDIKEVKRTHYYLIIRSSPGKGPVKEMTFPLA